MKTMTCKQLGGACDKEFHAESFDEIAAMSKQHGIEMFQENDNAHLEAMQKMKQLMENPAAMREWFENKKQEFELLPDNQ
jgi:predicted small metal-binding protein